MLQDKNLFYYGGIYHRIIDGKMKEARQNILNLIQERTSVLDIGCGTGVLCFELCQHKHCKVVGLDLSLKMIHFAEERNTFQDVTFMHSDATDLSIFPNHSFDFAVMLVFIHELDFEKQKQALREALRVAKKLIICYSIAPLPKNKGVFLIWLAETLLGYEHKPHFKRFLTQGGIKGLLNIVDLAAKVEFSKVFLYGVREVVVVSRKEH